MSELDMKAEALNPKWWLIITAIVHTIVGVFSQLDPENDNELMVAGIFLIITVYLLYAAFMTSGRAQARLTAVLAGPIWVWFIVCAGLELDVTYATENVDWELGPHLAPPLILWGMTALTGVLGWNMEDE
jgi:Na+/proline symporter